MSTTVESTITFPYKRSLGPVLGAFMTALTHERLIGIRMSQVSRHLVTGAILSGALLFAVLRFLRGAALPVERPVIAVDVTRALGGVLMTEFVLPFELLAVLLLVGLLGALYFARPDV